MARLIDDLEPKVKLESHSIMNLQYVQLHSHMQCMVWRYYGKNNLYFSVDGTFDSCIIYRNIIKYKQVYVWEMENIECSLLLVIKTHKTKEKHFVEHFNSDRFDCIRRKSESCCHCHRNRCKWKTGMTCYLHRSNIARKILDINLFASAGNIRSQHHD